jgi:hypothetical protein
MTSLRGCLLIVASLGLMALSVFMIGAAAEPRTITVGEWVLRERVFRIKGRLAYESVEWCWRKGHATRFTRFE